MEENVEKLKKFLRIRRVESTSSMPDLEKI